MGQARIKSYEDGGIVGPAAQMGGEQFYSAAQSAGLSTDKGTLNQIVDLVNKGYSVKDAAKTVASRRGSKKGAA